MLVSSLSKGGENEKGLGRQKEGVSGGDREGERSGDRVKRESRGNKNSSSAVSSSGVKSVKGVNELLASEAGVGVRVSDSEVKSSGSGSGSGGGSGIGGRGGSGSESSVEDVEDFSFLDSRIGKNAFGGENGDINNIVLNEIEGKSREVDGRSVDHGNAAARLLLNAFGDPGPDSTFNSNSGNDKNIFKSVGKN